MKINDLVEMAISSTQSPIVWKQINDLLNDNKYDEAAKLFLKKGGTARGAKRSWNVAQANNKTTGEKVPGNFFGLLDKKHNFDKFKEALSDIKVEKPEEKKKEVKQTAAEKFEQKKENLKDTSMGYKTSADVDKRKVSHIKDGDSKGSSLVRSMAKQDPPITEPIEHLEKRIGEKDLTAKQIERLDFFKKKEEKGEDFTKEERAEYLKVKNASKTKVSKKTQQAELVNSLNTDLDEVKDYAGLKKIFTNLINAKSKIDDRKLTEKSIKAIKKFSKGQDAVDLVALTKQVFRNKDNKKTFDKLTNKFYDNVKEDFRHIDGVDKILKRYEEGADITLDQLKSLQIEIKKFLPVMSEDKRFDKKGYDLYLSLEKKLSEFTEKGKEPTVDDLEELLDGLSGYHAEIKKEVKKSRTMKEDILYNLDSFN